MDELPGRRRDVIQQQYDRAASALPAAKASEPAVHDVTDPRDLLADELTQRREEGCDVAALEAPIAAALADATTDPAVLEALLEQLETTLPLPDWPYDEPATLAGIRAARPIECSRDSGDDRQPPERVVTPSPARALPDDVLRDRLLGAWLGRCAGCTLGKPVEGWSREAIHSYLTTAGAYPLTDYVPRPDPMPRGFAAWRPELEHALDGASLTGVLNASWHETTRGRVRWMARDDDIDYTILGIHILESHGFEFRPRHVADTWLGMLPFHQVYTAERAAYRNLIAGKTPPDTATYRNPYREWIGAQIRADAWGYVSPGRPGRAAEIAYHDASLSHVRNGVYGAMWAAALIAACFTAPDMPAALDLAAAQIPARSRLAAVLRVVREWHARGLDWEAARDELDAHWCARYSWVHTVNNAALVAMALLWGAGDFTRTIAYAVQGGWDTDCNGATAGSAFGALHGARALPRHWVAPLNDRIRSAVFGYDNARISELAERTLRLAKRQGAVE